MLSFLKRHKFIGLTIVVACASVYMFIRYVAHGNTDVFPYPWDILGFCMYLIGWVCMSAAPYVFLLIGMKNLADKHWRQSTYDKLFNIPVGLIYAWSVLYPVFTSSPSYDPNRTVTLASLISIIIAGTGILVYLISLVLPQKTTYVG